MTETRIDYEDMDEENKAAMDAIGRWMTREYGPPPDYACPRCGEHFYVVDPDGSISRGFTWHWDDGLRGWVHECEEE